jgi:hypothetical protein
MSKIKTISINDENLSSSDVAFLFKVFKNVTTELEEYEPKKPQILKRPDGSVICGLEEEDEIWYITNYYPDGSYYPCHEYVFREIKHRLTLLKEGKIFLPEDKHLAEKKAKMLSKQLEIKNEIDRLNAEEDNKEKQYYYLRLNKFQTGVEIEKTFENALNVRVFSEKTAEKISTQYSQEELKQYLGIII